MGGVSKGLEDAGFNVLKSYDMWENALKTHKHNLPNVDVENIDITQLKTQDIPDADLYHFSPPCQSFSTSGKKEGTNSDKGQLIYETVKILKDKKPKMFTFENVKGLTQKNNKDDFDNLINTYKDIGYICSWKVINVYDYGVIQNRERLILVGIRNDINVVYEFPDKIPNNKKLKDIIGNVINNKGILNHKPETIEKIKYVPYGGSILDIPLEIRPKAFANAYVRLKWDEVPPTITRNYNCPCSANCIHPEEHRALSDTEALLIQGFDEDWEVVGSSKNLQIGNALPPQIMKVIGKDLIHILEISS